MMEELEHHEYRIGPGIFTPSFTASASGLLRSGLKNVN